MTLKDIFKIFELPLSVLFGLAIISGTILLLPHDALFILGLNQLPATWRTILGITFLFALVMWSLRMCIKLVKLFEGLYYKAKFPREFDSNMRNLSPPEGTILVELSKQPTYTAQLPMNDGVVMRLSHKMMIQPTSAQHLTDEYLRISYTLTPVALKYIQTHSEFVKQYSVENSAYVYELLKN